jgi:NO-binding membrane sensor protein with MHYT domain
MNLPLFMSDISFRLAIVTIIILIASELLNASPSYIAKLTNDKRLLRFLAGGSGLAFLKIVLMHNAGNCFIAV